MCQYFGLSAYCWCGAYGKSSSEWARADQTLPHDDLLGNVNTNVWNQWKCGFLDLLKQKICLLSFRTISSLLSTFLSGSLTCSGYDSVGALCPSWLDDLIREALCTSPVKPVKWLYVWWSWQKRSNGTNDPRERRCWFLLLSFNRKQTMN